MNRIGNHKTLSNRNGGKYAAGSVHTKEDLKQHTRREQTSVHTAFKGGKHGHSGVTYFVLTQQFGIAPSAGAEFLHARHRRRSTSCLRANSVLRRQQRQPSPT